MTCVVNVSDSVSVTSAANGSNGVSALASAANGSDGVSVACAAKILDSVFDASRFSGVSASSSGADASESVSAASGTRSVAGMSKRSSKSVSFTGLIPSAACSSSLFARKSARIALSVKGSSCESSSAFFLAFGAALPDSASNFRRFSLRLPFTDISSPLSSFPRSRNPCAGPPHRAEPRTPPTRSGN